MSTETARARGLLARGGWIDVASADGTYRLRLGQDRRSRAAMTLSETTFRDLVSTPGLKGRPGGGWMAQMVPAAPTSPPCGAPGRIEGERLLIQPNGQMTRHAANLGESPIAWLARRRDASGQPWLTPAEAAAGDRLRLEAEQAQAGPSLTMRWDALPRTGGGSAARVEPSDHALSAVRRVERAMSAVGPQYRPILTRICLRGDSLQLAETGLGLRRRNGKTLLKQALQALASHYGIG